MNTTTDSITSCYDPKTEQKPNKRGWIGRTRPIWAWSLILLVVNLPLFWGEIRTSMIFLPEAVVAGQWWRIITYPLVHLSWYHLVLDAGAFIILLQCLEEKRWVAKTLYLVGASAGSLLISLAMDPTIFQRGLTGLSGIAHGLMAVTALEMIRHHHLRYWGLSCLALVAIKCIYELGSGQVVFEFMHMGQCGYPMATSHAGGVLGSLVFFLLLNTDPPREIQSNKSAVQRAASRPGINTSGQTFLRLAARTLTRLMYRVRYEDLEHIPDKGPAILVCNHVSYVDWLIISSACKRPVHFVMHAHIYRWPLLHWLFRLGRGIPIDTGKNNPKVLHQAFKEIAAVLQSGGLLCLFPEGRLTQNGQVEAFRPGIEKIIQCNPVPVIPLALRGLWGSFFSHKDGPAMRRWPRKILGKIELAAGKTICPHQTTAINLRSAVQKLRGDRA